MSSHPAPIQSRIRPVRALDDKVITPEHGRWDEARRAWNLAVDQSPAAVVFPETAEDVVAAVHLAVHFGLRIAAQGTGHNAGPLGYLGDTLLIKTEGMRGIEVDPAARIARVEAGVLWIEVVEAAARHGLAALAGSSPDVGVIGYTLGGGLSWLGRKYGLAANNVEAIELVTADGTRLRADRENEPDLFWAMRGGGGSFGVVTALEIRLFPISEVYAGLLWWPIERGDEVLHAWHALTESGLPDELTTVGRYLQLPPLPDIPEPVRGKSFVVVEAIHVGDPAQANELLEPLRALAPINDTIETIPVQALSRLHMDPQEPVPGIADGSVLSHLDKRAIDELERVAGAASGSPLLSVEVRHLGGELGRARPQHGALSSIDGDYAMFAVGITPTPEAHVSVTAHVELVKEALVPWTARHMYLNFAETSRSADSFWSEHAYARLRRIKAVVDPSGRMHANHPITARS
jgi:FAD/FMN-containing dehydrogenase